MISFYIPVLILIGLIWYGGYDGTMRLIAYIDLNTRYRFLMWRLYRMRKKLAKELDMPVPDFETFIKEFES